MRIQQFNPKMISISQLRRDIDVLEKVLTEEEEALVMRYQSLLFVAMAPERYQRLQAGKSKVSGVDAAVAAIEKIRHNFVKAKRSLVSDYVVKMRNERAGKWKK